MDTTIVVDSGGVIRMNEDYKHGFKMTETLRALPLVHCR